MDTHKNAPLAPKGREAMVRCVIQGGLSQAAAARQFKTTPKTVGKWVKRFSAEGMNGLRDRSSRPLSSPSQTSPATRAAIETLRRQRRTGKQIAAEAGVSPATVSRILRRLGLNRLSALEPAEPVRRYERAHPGEMIHMTSRNSAVSSRSDIASPAIAGARATAGRAAGAPAGSSSTSASMTLRASPSPRSCRTRALRGQAGRSFAKVSGRRRSTWFSR